MFQMVLLIACFIFSANPFCYAERNEIYLGDRRTCL